MFPTPNALGWLVMGVSVLVNLVLLFWLASALAGMKYRLPKEE